MIVGLFSDVHANLPALQTFIRLTAGVADAYVCLGDIVNYGPWNDECLELVHALPRVTVLEGNHERWFLESHAIQAASPLVREFSEYSRRDFSRVDLITDLAQSCELGPYLCAHTIADARIYPDTALHITRDHVIGHSHHQFARMLDGYALVNCGSVGQNRRDIELIEYALYDSDTHEISLHQAPYPFGAFLDGLNARGYPRRCIEYYRGKQAAAG